MKKFVTFVLVAVTALSMTCTAFAAPSPENSDIVNNSGATATIDGKAASVTVKSVGSGVSIPTADQLVKDGLVKEGAKVLGAADITVDGASAEHPVTVTVQVAGVKASTSIVVLHYVNGAWKVENSSTGDGTVTIYGLTSCSPFLFVEGSTPDNSGDTVNNTTNNNTINNSTTNNNTTNNNSTTNNSTANNHSSVNNSGSASGTAAGISPATGENAMLPVVMIICVLAAAGVVLVSRRRRA